MSQHLPDAMTQADFIRARRGCRRLKRTLARAGFRPGRTPRGRGGTGDARKMPFPKGVSVRFRPPALVFIDSDARTDLLMGANVHKHGSPSQGY